MRVSFLTVFAMSAAALAQLGQVDIDRPVAITVHLGTEDTVSFRLSQRVVTDIDLHVRGAEYSIPLQCAGGLHDVNFGTVELVGSGREREKTDGSFALLFDMGNDEDRRFSKLPRVQLSFSRGRLTEMLVTNMTSERSAFSSKLCSSVPVGPITCRDTRQLQGLAPEALVQQLRDLPTPLPAMATASDGERRRRSIYEELLDWGAKSIPPLVAALKDLDVRLRRNAALAFMVLAGGWWPFECGPATLDIRPALPVLVAAFGDSDPDVRAWAAQAVGGIGANAADAVPALTELLKNDNEGSRNSACIALGKIGPGAKAALPALRVALSDKSQDVRRFAARAIQSIEQ
jgi:HEAT repeats